MLVNPAMSNPDTPKSKLPRSTLISRNVTISSHRTSIRLEPEMWSGLSEICRREGGTLHEVCTMVSSRKGENTSLTTAIRVFVMAYYRTAATEDGHTRAGHGYGVAMMGMNGDNTRPPPTAVAKPATASTSSPAYGGMTSRAFSMSSGGTRGGNGR